MFYILKYFIQKQSAKNFILYLYNKYILMVKIECAVHLAPTDKESNIRLFEDGTLDWRGKNFEGGENVKVTFHGPSGLAIASSEKEDDLPQIGLDFLWPYIQTEKRINSVYVSFTEEGLKNVKLHSDGSVVVSRCDEKEYSEKDVVMMLSYAVAHEKVTSKEMKEKVDKTLNWFKSNI